MVPPDSTEETTCGPSCGRPKRGAAVRAEGVFRALALTGAVPEETSGSDLTVVGDKAGVSAAAAAAAEFEATASGVAAAVAVTSPEACELSFDQSFRPSLRESYSSVGDDSAGAKQAVTCSTSRTRATTPSTVALTTIDKKKSKVGNPIEQKRAEVGSAIPAMRRGAGARLASGRSEIQSKPEGKASAAAMAQVLQNLSGFGMGRMRTPANPIMEDVWKGVDGVLQNLPNTSELTVDDLVGHSRLRRFRPSEEIGSCGCGDSSCEEPFVTSVNRASRRNPSTAVSVAYDVVPVLSEQKDRCPWVIALGVMPGSGTSSIAGKEKPEMAEVAKQRAGAEEALAKQGVGVGARHDAVQGDGEELGSLDESARLRTLPRQKMVDDAMEEFDQELEEVEMRVTNTFHKLATKIEDLRSDPSSPEEIKRREWMEKTLRAYEPLRRQKAENERRERKRKDEEQEAVCYVCGSGYHSHNDTIVFCERCCVAVHASCYNAEGVHLVDKWYCDFCQFGISKAKRCLEATIANAEAVAVAAAAITAEPSEAMKTENQAPTPIAEDGDEADARTTVHPQHAAKKRNTSSKGPSGGDKMAGAAGDVAAAAKGRASLAAMGIAQSPRGPDDAVSSLERSPSLFHSADVPLTVKMDRETKVPYSQRGKQIFSTAEADAMAAGEWSPPSPPLKPSQRRGAEAATAGGETTGVKAMEVDGSLAERGGGDGMSGGAGSREAATSSCKPNGIEASFPPTEEALERRGWAPTPSSAMGSEVTVAVARGVVAGAVAGALEASIGNGHGHGQNCGGIFDANGAGMNGHVAEDGQDVRQRDPRSRTFAAPWESNGAVDAAKALTEADVSALKRNAQHANKRSWEDFSGKAKGGHAAADAVAGEAAAGVFEGEGVGSSGLSGVGAGNGSTVKGTARVPSAPPPCSSSSSSSNRDNSVTAVATVTSSRSELPSCSSAAVASYKGGTSSSASARGASPRKVDAGGNIKYDSGSGNDIVSIAAAKQGLLERAAALAGSVPAVAEALAALEKAEAVVGIELPPKDKGPPDPDAVCVLCPVPRGAFLRADKGNGGVAWCHCLCALSKELLIEDRVVKLRGRIKCNGGTCSKCRKGPGGGLILCSKDGCSSMFHPTCGQLWEGSAVRGPHLHPSEWKARCRKHAEPPPPGSIGYIPPTAHMPVKDLYKLSARPVPRTIAKAASADFVDSGGSSVSGCDEVIARYKAEAREVASRASGDFCPAGYCHRCRRRRKWTVGCATCDQFYCAFCIANLRESPFSVLEMAKAASEAKVLGFPPPKERFTCYSCRGTCGCAGCEKAMPKTDMTVKNTKGLKTRVKHSPAHSSTSTADRMSTSTSSSTSPPRNESPTQLTRSDIPKLKAAAAAIMSDSSGWTAAAFAVSAVESGGPSEPAPAAASHSPALRASASPSAPSESVPKKAADNHRAAHEKRLATPKAVDPSLHGKQYRGVEGAWPHANAQAPTPDAPATRVTPPGHSPPPAILGDDDASLLLCFDAQFEKSGENGRVAEAAAWSSNPDVNGTVAGVSTKPSGAATNAPSQLRKQIGGGNHADGDCSGVQVSPEMRPASAGQLSDCSSSATVRYAGLRTSAANAAVSAPWSSSPAITPSQASSNVLGRAKTSSVFRDNEYKVSAAKPATSATMHAPGSNGICPADSNALANHTQTQQRSKSNVQRMQAIPHPQAQAQAHAHTQAQLHARAQANANAHSYVFVNANHVHVQRGPGAMMPTLLQYSSATLATAGASPSLVAAAEKAEALRRKARNALEAAKLLSQAVVDAKAFSDQNNKAAMWRVEAATKLKDRLIMANELMNGYHSLRRNAENEARLAAKDKLAAIARLREAEEALRVKNPAAKAGETAAVNPASGMDEASAKAWWLSRESSARQSSSGTGGAMGLSIPATYSTSNGGDGCSHARPESNGRGGRGSPFRSPTGVLTNMKPSQGTRMSISVIEALRLEVRAAAATAREKEATLNELAKRQKRAEEGRTELVHDTQRASEAASEASQAAMHYEQEMRCKQAEEQAGFRLVTSAEHEALAAEWEVQIMLNNLGVGVAGGFGGNVMGMANGGLGGGHVFRGVGNAATGGGASGGVFGCGGAVNDGGDGVSGGVGGGGSGNCSGGGDSCGSHMGGQRGGFTWSQYQRQGQNLDSGRRHPPNPG